SSTPPRATRWVGCSRGPDGGSGRAISRRWRRAPGRSCTRDGPPAPCPRNGAACALGGVRRRRRLGQELVHLRMRLSESLPDLVDEVARTLGLETELASAPGVSPAAARAHLDALHGGAAEVTELAELPSP